MKTHELFWNADQGLVCPEGAAGDADLVVYFGPRQLLTRDDWHKAMSAAYGKALLFGCSSGGQISGRDVGDDSVNAVAIKFERTTIRAASAAIANADASRQCARSIAEQLAAPDLAGVIVLSDGLNVNGSELAAGFGEALGRNVPVCGGLAGDGANFAQTCVGLGGPPKPGVIAAIGLYGNAIRIGYGSEGGWEAFGPMRTITRSRGNVLLELDGRPALDLYERYLGPEDVKALPGSALRYPLLIRNPDIAGHELVRTILSIDRNERSMTFAGDMPKGWTTQLMRSNFNRLADGAADAAGQSCDMLRAANSQNGVSFLISCIGRRLMMGQRVVQEIEAADERLPPGYSSLGFYSYGEIAPHTATGVCELRNQTMTVMTLAEAVA